jgi:hypothetical protein
MEGAADGSKEAARLPWASGGILREVGQKKCKKATAGPVEGMP